jgi:predicted amidohydrolase
MGLGERFGRLAVGRQADVALLRLEEGRFELTDVEGQVRIARQRLAAEAVFKRGVYSTCDHGLPAPVATNGDVRLASAR